MIKEKTIGIPFDFDAGPVSRNVLVNTTRFDGGNCQRGLQIANFHFSDNLLPAERVLSSEAFFDPTTPFIVPPSKDQKAIFDALRDYEDNAFGTTLFGEKLFNRFGKYVYKEWLGVDEIGKERAKCLHEAFIIGGQRGKERILDLDGSMADCFKPFPEETFLIYHSSGFGKRSQIVDVETYLLGHRALAAKVAPAGVSLSAYQQLTIL